MVKSDDVAGVREAIAAGADVNARDRGSNTPLLLAVPLMKNPEAKLRIVRILLDAGADANAKVDDGMTPLMWAAFNPYNARMLEMLIASGADVNARMNDGTTALAVAALLGNREETAVLVKAGADVNADLDGLTPLHLAAGVIAMEREGLTGSFEERARQTTNIFLSTDPMPDFPGVTKLLVEAGADPNARSADSRAALLSFMGPVSEDKGVYDRFKGKTPLEFARLLGNERVVQYLESRSAR
jgi:ankyrin repeat protein